MKNITKIYHIGAMNILIIKFVEVVKYFWWFADIFDDFSINLVLFSGFFWCFFLHPSKPLYAETATQTYSLGKILINFDNNFWNISVIRDWSRFKVKLQTKLKPWIVQKINSSTSIFLSVWQKLKQFVLDLILRITKFNLLLTPILKSFTPFSLIKVIHESSN